MQFTETRTEKWTEKSTEKSTGKSTKLTTILLRPCIKSATMSLTGWSRKRTSGDNNRINVNYQSLMPARYILQSMRKHCTKAQESAGALELGKYNHRK